MKTALSAEAKAWKLLLCRYLNEEYKKKMTDMTSFITTYLKKLSRPLNDLDDVRLAMEALSVIRDNKIEMDMTLGPIEVRLLLIFCFINTVLYSRSQKINWEPKQAYCHEGSRLKIKNKIIFIAIFSKNYESI